MTSGKIKFATTNFVSCFLFLVACLLFLVAIPVSAQTPPRQPSQDPLCWTQQLCSDNKGDFVSNPRCTGSWGLCYPKPEANVYNLQIPIGGVRQVSNISNYVRIGYQAGLGIAFTVSIVLVMVAGFRWMTAGGNATTIGAAKTMMGNVAIGILLLLGAYLIFQTINPDITALKLPRVAMIRPQTLDLTAWCDNLFPVDGGGDYKIQFASAGREPNLRPSEEFGGNDYGNISKRDMAGFDCGLGYYPITDPSQACFAQHCSKPEDVCLRQDDGRHQCVTATLAGEISTGSDQNVLEVSLWQVCNDGEVSPGTTFDVEAASADLNTAPSGKQTYIFDFDIDGFLHTASSKCDNHGGEKGLMLAAKNSENVPDTWALRRSGAQCSVLTKQNDIYDLDEETNNPLRTADPSSFFQRQDLRTRGLRCNISL